MLPDLPGLKQDLQYIFDRYLRKAIQERLGAFADVPRPQFTKARKCASLEQMAQLKILE